MSNGSPERPSPATSIAGEEAAHLELSENTKKALRHSSSVGAAVQGTAKKEVAMVRKDGVVLARNINRIGQHLAREKGREVETWRDVIERVERFDKTFLQDLDLLMSKLNKEVEDKESGLPKEDAQNLRDTLRATREFAARAFEERRFYAPNYDRPIERVEGKRFGIPGVLGIKPFKRVAESLQIAQEHEARAFARVPDKPKDYDKQLPNRPHDSELRDLMRNKLRDMKKHLAEFMRIGDRPLPDASVIDRMKREYDLIQEATEKFRAFEDDLGGLVAMPDFEHAVDQLPTSVAEKLEPHLSRRLGEVAWFWRDEGEYEVRIPNPKRLISEQEKNALAYEAIKMRERLARISEAYAKVIEACGDLKI